MSHPSAGVPPAPRYPTNSRTLRGARAWMGYSVFCQSPEPRVDAIALRAMAERHFRLSVDVLSEEPADGTYRLRVRVARHDPARTLDATIAARRRTHLDVQAARTAEARGKAGGMASLAERCPSIWEVQTDSDDEELLLELCALLASVALGPVLPSDHSTLFGVRGARERAALKR